MPKLKPDEIQLATAIPRTLHRRLKLLAVRRGVTITRLVTDALRQLVARPPKGAP